MKDISFIPGLPLNRKFFFEVVKPLLEQKYPHLPYSAGLIGYGSDVLGFDTATSTDHNWGPRCLIFLNHEDYHLAEGISGFLRNNLPLNFLGYSTNFSDPRYDFTQKMEQKSSGPVRHLIEIHDAQKYFENQLKVDNINSLSLSAWLKCTDQVLLELTAGEVFHDGLKKLNPIRRNLAFYPPDIMKLRLASLWLSIWNEEAFVGRSTELDDLIGSRIISTRIINTLMKICFYLERKYIPYSKWFSTAFRKLESSTELLPLIQAVFLSDTPVEIEDKLGTLYTAIVELHNKNTDLPKLDNRIRHFFNRPYKVIFAESIVEKLLESIENPDMRNIDVSKICFDIKLDSVDFSD